MIQGNCTSHTWGVQVMCLQTVTCQGEVHAKQKARVCPGYNLWQSPAANLSSKTNVAACWGEGCVVDDVNSQMSAAVPNILSLVLKQASTSWQ
jgi:hypothetical protein